MTSRLHCSLCFFDAGRIIAHADCMQADVSTIMHLTEKPCYLYSSKHPGKSHTPENLVGTC